MRKSKEILRLKWAVGVSDAAASRSCHVARSTVADCIRRATAAGLSWPLPDEMDDARLEVLLYPPSAPSSCQRPLPDLAHVHQEMKRKGVTLFLLWQEYKAALSKAPLLSVPKLLYTFDIYANPITLLAWLLGIGGLISAPFVLRDRFYVSVYEQKVYDDNYAYVENQYQSYKLKHDFFVKVVEHPFEKVLTDLELIQSESIELNSEEKKVFIGCFFESPVVESEVL